MRPVITRMTFAGASPQVLVQEPLRLDAYGIGAAMVPVPGHTRGSCVVLLDDGGCRVVDNGRGIPVDPHPEYKGKSAAEVAAYAGAVGDMLCAYLESLAASA